MKLVEIQNIVSKNIKAEKFGYALSLDDPNLKTSWKDIIFKFI